MNRIELTLNTNVSDEDYKPELYLFDRITVDGIAIDERHAVSPWELVRSLYEPGEFGIFTCGCGHGGCAGIHNGIFVRHAPGTVRWRYRTPMSSGDLPETEHENAEHDDRYKRWLRESRWREFSFDRTQMVGAIEAALSGIRAMLDAGVFRPRDDTDFASLKALSTTEPYHGRYADSARRTLYLLADEEAPFFLDGSFVSGAELGFGSSLIRDFAAWRAERPAPRAGEPANSERTRIEWLEQGRTLLLRAYREGVAEDIDLSFTYGWNWDRCAPVDPWHVITRDIPRSTLDTTTPIPGVLYLSADSTGFEAWIEGSGEHEGESEIVGWMGQFYGPFLVPLDLERRLAEWSEPIALRDDLTGFDWWTFHGDGIALMRELKTTLGSRCRLVYVRSDEDTSENTPREIEIGEDIRFAEE